MINEEKKRINKCYLSIFQTLMQLTHKLSGTAFQNFRENKSAKSLLLAGSIVVSLHVQLLLHIE